MNPFVNKKCSKRRKSILQLEQERRSRLLFLIRKFYQRTSNKQLRTIEQFTASVDVVDDKDIHTNECFQ